MQAHREGEKRWKIFPRPHDVWGPRHRSKLRSTPKCTILKSRIEKKIFPEGPTTIFSPGLAVALDVPDYMLWEANRSSWICQLKSRTSVKTHRVMLFYKNQFNLKNISKTETQWPSKPSSPRWFVLLKEWDFATVFQVYMNCWKCLSLWGTCFPI